MQPHLRFAQAYQHLIPDQYPRIVSTLTVGVGAQYTWGFLSYRERAGYLISTQMKAPAHRSGKSSGRMCSLTETFVCTTKSACAQTPVEVTPTAMADKKNPDRTISRDKRTISDIRRVYLPFLTVQYCKIRAPSLSEIAHTIIRLQARNPPNPIA